MTQELPEGTVTVLFTDVVGSTDLTNRLGDEAARHALGACDELLTEAIAMYRQMGMPKHVEVAEALLGEL
jgi:class 3 adenylate cyclase